MGSEILRMMTTPVFDDRWQETFGDAWIPGYRYGLGVYILHDAKRADSLAEPETFIWES